MVSYVYVKKSIFHQIIVMGVYCSNIGHINARQNAMSRERFGDTKLILSKLFWKMSIFFTANNTENDKPDDIRSLCAFVVYIYI